MRKRGAVGANDELADKWLREFCCAEGGGEGERLGEKASTKKDGWRRGWWTDWDGKLSVRGYAYAGVLYAGASEKAPRGYRVGALFLLWGQGGVGQNEGDRTGETRG